MSGTYEYPAEVVYARNEERVRLREVAVAARDVLKAYDNAERESDWTGALIDTVLRTTLARLDGETEGAHEDHAGQSYPQTCATCHALARLDGEPSDG